jgi:hypothetical protein
MSVLLLLVHCVRVCAVCGCGMVDLMTLCFKFVLQVTPSPFLPFKLCPPPWRQPPLVYIDPIMLLYEDYVWVSLGNAMNLDESKAKQILSCLAPFPGVGFTRARLLSAWECLLWLSPGVARRRPRSSWCRCNRHGGGSER